MFLPFPALAWVRFFCMGKVFYGRGLRPLCAAAQQTPPYSFLGPGRAFEAQKIDWLKNRWLGRGSLTFQATRDIITSATLAFQNDENKTDQEKAKASWRSLADDFWSQTAAESDKNKKKILHRTKVYEWIVATCHMLMIGCGSTWESWPAPNNFISQNACHYNKI